MIGLCKMLGALVLVIPGFQRLKEWAYAGLVFDLVAGTYSFYAVGDPFLQWAPMFLFIGLIFVSYYLHHQRLQANG
jgi:type II secretory pathway component PulF